MIKLCIITTVPATIKAFFGNQLRFLQEHGYQATLITSSEGTGQDFGQGLPEGVKIEYVEMSRVIRPLDDMKAFFKILKIIRHGDYDIVQYVSPKGSLFGSIAAWIARVPVRLLLLWGLYYVTQNGFKKYVYKYITKLTFYLSTHVASDSNGNCRVAVQEKLCPQNKIDVVAHGSANGVDIERFNPDRLAPFRDEIRKKHQIPLDAFVFGTIAAIVGDKGINELIAAFVEIAEKYPNTCLLYVGQTAEKNPVKPETLKQIDNHKRIIHVGWQAEPEKYMAAMDVFVLPTYREGFGVVNIEASAMRLPVISTDVPGPQESIVNGQTGILVPAGEVPPLMDAMKLFLDCPLYLKKYGQAGRKRVQEYYEQKKLWQAILEHRKELLLKTGKYTENNGQIIRN
jgi:glycosyltransferase involved in cell wall biosynthesis